MVWESGPEYQVTQFSFRGISKGVTESLLGRQGPRAWSSKMPSCLCKVDPAKRLGILKTKMETWILFGVIFISDWEATQRENKYTFPWEKGKRERASYCVTLLIQQTISTWATGLFSPQAGRESFYAKGYTTQQTSVIATPGSHTPRHSNMVFFFAYVHVHLFLVDNKKADTESHGSNP